MEVIRNPYVDGLAHGTEIWYRKDGSKEKEIPYVYDRRHGKEIWYIKNGSKDREIVYEKGVKISDTGRRHGPIVVRDASELKKRKIDLL